MGKRSSNTGKAGNPRPRIEPGDPVFGLALENSDGKLIHFGKDQLHSGIPVFLWVADAPDEPDVGRLAALRRDIEGTGAAIYIVTRKRQPASPDETASDGIERLVDKDGILPDAFGLRGGGILVFDENFRLKERIAGTDFEAGLKTCRDIFGRTSAITLRNTAPVLIVPELFDDAMCRRIISYWQEGEKIKDGVATLSNAESNIERQDFKRRADVPIKDMTFQNEIIQLMERRVLPEMKKAFGFVPAHCEMFRIGCYDSADGGYFRRHRDNTTTRTQFRRYAMTVNLNTGEYEGGQLTFPEYGNAAYAPDKGGAVIFSCSLLHEAAEVTSGRRFGVFTFMYDQEGYRMQQENLRNTVAGALPGNRA